MSQAGSRVLGCTIIARNQLAKARVLAHSWHQHHPTAPFCALLLDSPDGFFRRECEPFQIISPAELDCPNADALLFQYGFPEIVPAIQPYFLSTLLQGGKAERIVYLSADTFILRPLNRLWEALEGSNVVLTPFLTRPAATGNGSRPTEADLVTSSLYNLDLLAMRESDVSESLLRWWHDRLRDDVHRQSELEADPTRWFNLAPALFDEILVFRQPEFHVGYWNYAETAHGSGPLARQASTDRIHVFNFRGLDMLDPAQLSPGTDSHGFPVDDNGALSKLLAEYQQLLIAAEWEASSGWTYGNDFYQSGPRISASKRREYRTLPVSADLTGNPFESLGKRRPGLPPGLRSSAAGSRFPFGVNVLGHLASEKGVGEMGRSNLRILHAAGIPCVANDFVDHGAHNVEERPSSYSITNPYPVNLVSVNADCLGQYVSDNPSYLDHHFNIAYWAWELSEFPAEWAGSFGYVDEVWTLSEFARDSIAGSSPVPVRAVHCSLEVDYEPEVVYRRSDFEIPEDIFVFLFFFDFHSYIERKNPIGLVKAFKNAFGLRQDVQLLIKSSHSRQHLDQLQLLKEAAAGSNVRVLDEVLSRDAKHGLMMAADCYVSLHRSEGFGLTIAEAMLCGKPTIATDYSGNRDFMTVETNYPVPYKLIDIDRDHGPYRVGQQWAQPDLEYASEVMRYIERNREAAATVGECAKSYVSHVLHPATIGARVRSRLAELGFPVEAGKLQEAPPQEM